MNKVILLLLAFCLSSCASLQKEKTPVFLVGVWVNEEVKLKGNGQLLVEGLAVYLTSNGAGAMLAGPPAMGRKILTNYDSVSNTIFYQEVNTKGKVVREGKMIYNVINQTLTMHVKNSTILLYREFDEVWKTTKKFFRL